MVKIVAQVIYFTKKKSRKINKNKIYYLTTQIEYWNKTEWKKNSHSRRRILLLLIIKKKKKIEWEEKKYALTLTFTTSSCNK